MSILFTPINIGNVRINNRFIHSATYEVMALKTGEVSDKLIRRYQNLAKGEVGLIIPGYMYVHPWGKAYKYQTGIHSDDMIPGLRKLVEAVHKEGGKIAFQLVHAGRQTTKARIGQTPIGPSSSGRDPINFVKPKEMSVNEIQEAIQAFGAAARRAVSAGVDGIQLHAAHGYLINQFLSPFFNHRKDEWGWFRHQSLSLLKRDHCRSQEGDTKRNAYFGKIKHKRLYTATRGYPFSGCKVRPMARGIEYRWIRNKLWNNNLLLYEHVPG